MGTVYLNENDLTCTITSALIIYGTAASDALAEKIATDVSTYWNAPAASVIIKGQRVRVLFHITGVFAPDLTPEDVVQNIEPSYNFFRIAEQTSMDVSFVDGIGSNTGCFKLANLLQTGTTAAHEYGHTIGLDHPKNMDIRGKGIPGIMYPRGTLTDAIYQYNPLGLAGDSSNGGTMNPMHRQVTLQDIELLQLQRLRFNKEGTAMLGDFSSVWHY